MTLNDMIAEIIRDTGRPDLGPVVTGGDGKIPAAIFSTTLALHTCDFFTRDIVEVTVVFPVSAYLQTLDTTSLERWRSLAYCRKWDNSSSESGAFGEFTFGSGGFGNSAIASSGQWRGNSSSVDTTSLGVLPPGVDIWSIGQDLAFSEIEVVDLGGLFDSYGREKQDVAYAAGNAIRIKSSTALTVAKVGYYAYPFLDMGNRGDSYVSWIAEEFPWAIIYAAEAIIFNSTGDNETARQLTRASNYRTGDPGGPATQHMQQLKMLATEAVGR